MAQVIQDARYVMVTTQTETIWNTVGTGSPLLRVVPAVLIAGVFIIGVVVFRKNSRGFAEEL